MVQRLTSSPRRRVTSSSGAPGAVKSVTLDRSADAPQLTRLSVGRPPPRADRSRGSRRRSRFGRAKGSACAGAVTSPQSSHFCQRTTTLGDSHDGQAKHSSTASYDRNSRTGFAFPRGGEFAQSASVIRSCPFHKSGHLSRQRGDYDATPITKSRSGSRSDAFTSVEPGCFTRRSPARNSTSSRYLPGGTFIEYVPALLVVVS